MTVIEISEPGPPEVLKPAERPAPQPGAGEVLIRVAVAGVARADLFQRQGKYPPPPGASDIPGLDVAGTIEMLGEAVTGFAKGERVCAILAGGGYAEFCTAPVEQVLPIPENWTFEEAACLPENLFTVYDNVITRAGLKRGETILIHGGSSGIGTMAIMLASAYEATILVTAGSEEKCRACLELGAHHAINYKTSDFAAEVLSITNGRGVDVILDMVGGSYLARNLSILATEGRLAMIATLGGHLAELDISMMMHKRLRVMGSTIRVRTPAEKGKIARELREHIWQLLPAKKTIRPVIDRTFPLREAWKAHARMQSSEHVGKILLVN